MIDAPLVGQQLGNYHVDALIGMGAMAQVYRAHDIELDRTVAIKLIGVDMPPNPEFATRLEREARTVAKLRHPNIVGIYHKGSFQGMTYLVIEYINGCTLEDLLKSMQQKHRLPDALTILAVCGTVTTVLDYAHTLNIIHRDVKPSNIMIDLDGMIYLTDFGLALRLEEGTEGTAFGSPNYIAPEQVVSSANATPQSDLYSLGVILFRMLTGELPYRDDNPVQVATMHLKHPVPLPSDLNPNVDVAVDRVLLRALAKQPADRFASGQVLQKALAAALGLPDMVQPTFKPYLLNPRLIASHFVTSEVSYGIPRHLLRNLDNPD